MPVLQSVIDRLCRLFSVLMVACLALMVVMVFGNVVLRYAFNSGITVSEELSRWLFVWMTFLGAVVAVRNRAHLGTDALVSRLPILGKKICFVLAHLLMLYLCWLMATGGWVQTVINVGTTSAVMEASMAWFSVSGVVFAVLAGAIILLDLVKFATGRLADSELVGIVESEEVPHGGPPNDTAPPVAGNRDRP
jgi:TRAP-type C4-dicarboxylate transport system permease small subunit